ncbi:transcription elongation factor TFIIS [Schizosaccharomyces japonicus yFS275]|uniref:Transcription elongation factor n=1 Tax=Schizosaccharomyces japonicus (strain yFS275 / FY16936) TaxID=402676 RepID=B6K0X3_SCHJY|nr:transcription elongation factor TFIIS [Schizosaccharomyces japonicus yFS275]EEB07594.1 transcription elongation factor TFIIS [Schizosaccharomyces japonicus yFS275]
MDIAEIRSVKSSLEKSIQDKNIEAILRIMGTLKARVVATEELLKETRLGLVVGKLRSHSNEKVSEQAREIVKKWKADVTHKRPSKTSQSTSSSSASVAVQKTSSAAVSQLTKKAESNAQRTFKTDNVSINVTDDRIRNNCIGLLYNALAMDTDEPSSVLLKTASAIDVQVLSMSMGKTDSAYRNKMRSLYMNLKDKQNPQLRKRVISGAISPKRLSEMSSAELASEDRRKEDAKLEQENLFHAQGAKPQKAITDLFTCGKCKQKKVSYFQMQTRSADEPMTTFCECTVCGNRWKFS